MPLFPGFDTLGTLAHIMRTGYDYSWFILTQRIIEKEFALSGSEQNPNLTGKSVRGVLGRVGKGAPPPVEAFKTRGVDFVVRDNLADLVRGMNQLAGEERIGLAALEAEIVARDRQIDNPFCKDLQITAIRGARNYLGDKLIRVASPHRLLDPAAGPLIAVRLNILTRRRWAGCKRICQRECCAQMGSRSQACTRRAREPGSEAGECTATGHWKGPFWAGASFRGELPAGLPLLPSYSAVAPARRYFPAK